MGRTGMLAFVGAMVSLNGDEPVASSLLLSHEIINNTRTASRTTDSNNVFFISNCVC